MSGPANDSGFDPYARDYEQALGRARRSHGIRAHAVCDYGCGTGDTVPLLRELLGAERLLGLDSSQASLGEARRCHALPGVVWAPPNDATLGAGAGQYDLAYCNGVFHHIPPTERLACARQVLQLLRPGGLWFFWENNPYNPGTRWVMSRIPFDRDAITLRPAEARRLGAQAGGRWLETSYHFYFPKFLRALRRAEPWLRALPLGREYWRYGVFSLRSG